MHNEELKIVLKCTRKQPTNTKNIKAINIKVYREFQWKKHRVCTNLISLLSWEIFFKSYATEQSHSLKDSVQGHDKNVKSHVIPNNYKRCSKT